MVFHQALHNTGESCLMLWMYFWQNHIKGIFHSVGDSARLQCDGTLQCNRRELRGKQDNRVSSQEPPQECGRNLSSISVHTAS